MPLNFPNASRSFDATRRAVRFWGYDSALEMSFFVTEGALKKLQPDMLLDERGMLHAFDAHFGRTTGPLRVARLGTHVSDSHQNRQMGNLVHASCANSHVHTP